MVDFEITADAREKNGQRRTISELPAIFTTAIFRKSLSAMCATSVWNFTARGRCFASGATTYFFASGYRMPPSYTVNKTLPEMFRRCLNGRRGSILRYVFDAQRFRADSLCRVCCQKAIFITVLLIVPAIRIFFRVAAVDCAGAIRAKRAAVYRADFIRRWLVGQPRRDCGWRVVL